MPNNVTFQTNCYEKDWRSLLKTDRLKNMIEYNCFPFKDRMLFINNVNDPLEVGYYAQKLKAEDVITDYRFSEDYIDEALEYFDINRESFGGGINYSIAELVGIFLCNTEYLLSFKGDAILEKPSFWIEPAIARMQSDNSIKVANPLWNNRYDEARHESAYEDEEYYTGYGFSDQCFLISTRDFRQKIYNEHNPLSERFPIYGGASFEKQVDAWMRNHNYYRITSKKVSYIHKSF